MIEQKILYIQSSVDENFRLVASENWKSTEAEHRIKIRNCIEENFTSRFNRQQLAWLNDLNQLPQADDGFFSIAHCKTMGGFTYSKHPHGFDIEQTSRISTDIIQRTASAKEQAAAPLLQFLWVGKEAGFKALSSTRSDLLITDLLCTQWQSHFENQVFSFRLNSLKTLDFGLNIGFIFSEGDNLFCTYFK
jgi:hypothetical protein